MIETYQPAISLAEMEIRPVTEMGHAMWLLELEAEHEGHRFMCRLREEWNAETNRFDAPGEFLLGVYSGRQLLATGGVNCDPYASDSEIARLRHVYVASSARRAGVGTLLVGQIRTRAARTFRVLRLRTSTAEAARFYERLGFGRIYEKDATHRADLHSEHATAALPAGYATRRHPRSFAG